MTILVFLLVLFLASPALAITRYVKTTCTNGLTTYNPATDLCTGGSATVHNSIPNALSAWSSGDVIDIRAGTYTVDIGSSNIATSKSGTASATGWGTSSWNESGASVIQGHAGETVVINGGLGWSSPTKGTEYKFFVFRNLTIQDHGTGVGGGGNGGTSHHILWDNVRIINSPDQGYASGSDGSATFLWIKNALVRDSGTDPQYHHCFYLETANNIIENSECYNQTGAGIHNYTQNVPAANNIYRYNYIHDVGGVGILIWFGSNNQVYGNVITKNGSAGIGIRGADSTVVQNNTVFDNVETAYVQDSAGVSFLGNIFWSNHDDDFVALLGSTSNTYTNNLCANSGTGCTIFGTNPFASTTPGSGSYLRLSGTGSPAYNTAVSVTCPPVDIAGTTRPQNGICDIGAYEFSGAPSTSIAITSPTSSPTYITTASTVTVGGTASCPAAITSVTWTSSRVAGGTASGTSSWSATGISLTANRRNDLTFTVNCSGGTTASATLQVRANGANAAVFLGAMDEGSGSTVADTSPLASNGTFAGSGNGWTTASGGKFGSAVTLDGNGYVSVPDLDARDLSIFTLEAQLFPTTQSGYQATITKEDTSSPVYEMYAYSGGICAAGAVFGGLFNDVGAELSACINTPLPLNTWSHIAITYDGANIKSYLNGSLVQTVAATYLPLESTGIIRIGASQFGEGFIGRVDEVRIYNYARSGAEILSDSTTAIGSPAPPVPPATLTIGTKPVSIGNKSLSIGTH